jgi:zinc transporter ZupT
MDSPSGSYLTVVLLAFLSGGTTLIGVALAIAIGNNPRMTATGIGFSTGIMILIALCEPVPESLRIVGLGATSLSGGLGAVMILGLHIVIPHIHLGREQAAPTVELRAAYLVVFGLILHDDPEGFAMAKPMRS